MKDKRSAKHVIPYRSVIKWLVRLRRSPQAIAGGFAMGTFVAFTPTIGIQFAIVLLLATLFNLNRPAALVTIWITNVATMAPIYTFNYWVGSQFWEGPGTADVYRVFTGLAARLLALDGWEMIDQFRMLLELGREIIIPLVIGSVIVGLVAALLVYAASFAVIAFLVRHKQKKRVLA